MFGCASMLLSTMPAIHPARLRLQTSRLAELYDRPVSFVRALHGLLGLYSDRTHRSGQSGKPSPLISSYSVPAPVLRYIIKELRPEASRDAQQTINVCNALWVEPYYECRYLAATLLGLAPATPAEPVLSQLETWIHSSPEEQIMAILLDQGLFRLRQENPEKILSLAREWLSEQSTLSQQYALRLMLPLALDPESNLLPSIYMLITPLVRSAPQALRPELISLLLAAAKSSPLETAYMLRQNLEAPDNPDTAWLVRQVLNAFPPSQQESLKSAMSDIIKEKP